MTRKEIQCIRITQMENILNDLIAANTNLSNALDAYEALQNKVKKLSDYYDSNTWSRDFSDDEKGLLPPDLKRGVLSEDEVFDALSDYRELYARMLDIVSKGLRKGTI